MMPGDRVGGRFVLEREIGSGGMSTVYLGRDEVLDRPVAVKVLRPGFEGSDAGFRFEREGRTAARLSHANVVQVYDAGDALVGERRIFYIVMEYLPGGTLKDLVDASDISEDELSRLGSGIAAGLAHAHERGVIHRDVKPHNVMMDEQGTPRLTDFGIAKALEEPGAEGLTGTHGYMGTASYSSPEQLSGGEITPKSDVYSLGVTLYYAAVGQPPYRGVPLGVAAQQMTKEPALPRSRGADIGDGMERIIMSCLARDPGRRPDAGTVRKRLDGLRSGRGFFGWIGRRTAPRSRTRTSSSVRILVAGATVIVLVAVISAGAILLTRTTPQNADDVREVAKSGSGGEGVGGSVGENPPVRVAAATVANMYVETTVQEDYESSYGYLSDGLRRREYPRLEDWRRVNAGLEALTFAVTPTTEGSDRTAVVTGEIMLIRSGVVRVGSGRWGMVLENGEWRIDSIYLDTEPAEADGESRP